VRFIVLLALLLPGCAIFQTERERCGSLLDKAWEELDISKAEGFAAVVSYGRAAALLAQAKIDQTQEKFPGCIEAAERARGYISESRKGR
jgi:recombinational DNA repair protein RecT